MMFKDFIELGKPQMVVFFVYVGAMSYLVEGGRSSSSILAICTIGVLASAGTNMVTAYIDKDLDALMKRTCSRPLQTGRVSPGSSLYTGILLVLLAMLISLLYFGPLVALLVLSAVVGVAVLYNKLLKTRTSLSTIVGAIPGSFPVLIGSAAAGTITAKGFALTGFLYMWQMPHFWLLSIRFKEDYISAGIPTLSERYGDGAVKKLVFMSSLLLVVYTLFISPFFGEYFTYSSLIFGMILLTITLQINRVKTVKSWHQTVFIAYIAITFIAALAAPVIKPF